MAEKRPVDDSLPTAADVAAKKAATGGSTGGGMAAGRGMIRKRGIPREEVLAMGVPEEERDAVVTALRVRRMEAQMAESGRCMTCWFPPADCVCSQMTPIEFSRKNVEFIVYMHSLELYNVGDDAKILLSAAPSRTSLFVFGREGDDEKLRAKLAGGNTVLLFPDATALSAAEAMASHLILPASDSGDGGRRREGGGGEGATTSHPPLQIMVLDGTWKKVKTMLKHLTKRVLHGLPAIPHVKLSPEVLSVYARTQTQADRICTIEALALFLSECGESEAATQTLVRYVQVNDACRLKSASRQAGAGAASASATPAGPP